MVIYGLIILKEALTYDETQFIYQCKETESYIDIHAPKMNDHVQSIINAVNDLDKSHTLVGYIDKEIHIINVSDVITFQVINKM